MVLVTGGTGFIGAYILKELVQKGHPVRAIRRSSDLPFFIDASILQQIEWVNGNLFDPGLLEDALTGVNAVIHAAGKVSYHHSDRRELYKTNIEGTANIVNLSLDKNIQRFIHISSVSAIGRRTDGGSVNEEKKWEENKKNTHYGISKFYGEMEVWRGFAEGLNGLILNPATVLGYGDWNSSSCRIFKNAYEEFPWYTQGVNGFVDVNDLAAVTVSLMESTLHNERYLISGENWSFEKLLKTIALGFGRKPPTRLASPLMGNIAWQMEKLKSIFTGRKPLLTRESARIAQSKTYFDNRKILEALPGFQFTPLEETIDRACRQYMSNLEKEDSENPTHKEE